MYTRTQVRHILEESAVVREAGSKRVDSSRGADVTKREHGAVPLEEWEVPIKQLAPEVVSHNMETVKRLTRAVRIQAKYERSLGVLRYLKENGKSRTKTGIMLGFGETKEEVTPPAYAAHFFLE